MIPPSSFRRQSVPHHQTYLPPVSPCGLFQDLVVFSVSSLLVTFDLPGAFLSAEISVLGPPLLSFCLFSLFLSLSLSSAASSSLKRSSERKKEKKKGRKKEKKRGERVADPGRERRKNRRERSLVLCRPASGRSSPGGHKRRRRERKTNPKEAAVSP